MDIKVFQRNYIFLLKKSLKTGCFDPSSTLFGCGSDDFRGYIWKIPSEHECLEKFDTSHGISYGESSGVCRAGINY